MMHLSGDVETNVGLFVHAIVTQPKISLPGKYAFVSTDYIPYPEVFKTWGEVMGKNVTYIECNREQAVAMFGFWIDELVTQLDMNAIAPDWTKGYEGVLFAKDFGIQDKMVGHKASLEMHKDKML